MKKLLIACGITLLGLQSASAQDADSWIPKQLGVGIGVGTTGITIDASTTVNRWFGVRAGVNIMPKIKLSTDFDLTTETGADINQLTNDAREINRINGKSIIDVPAEGFPETIEAEGKLTNTTFHFLVDFYPSQSSSFHATVGFYIGGKEFVSVYNKQAGILKPVSQWNEAIYNPTDETKSAIEQNSIQTDIIGAELGDYFITPDHDGNMKATIEVNAFRPYLGIGFGRAVPRKNRVGCQFDLGVQFWGSPKVYVPTYDRETNTYRRERLTADRSGEGSDVLNLISNITVYPTMTLRFVGRIF